MTATLTKTDRVLKDQGTHRDYRIYSRHRDEPGDTPTVVKIDHGTWDELGRPDAITVTIVPGDTLNGDE